MSSSTPLREADLVFPRASVSLSKTLSDLRRTHLSITNRLHSIAHDAAFVNAVADLYQLPLVANERCGSWYVHPDVKVGSAYFKSTDGHHGQWSFSLRRLNLQIFDILSDKQGCIIVDSTRRGKSMPDALSKTIPIWIAVFNRLLFPEQPDSHQLQTAERMVSQSEHSQIQERLPSLVKSLESLGLNLGELRAKLAGKPLLPTWVTPDTTLPDSPVVENEWHLIVLCTASGRTDSLDRQGANYVQGAADDSESWALGLDATTFWRHSPDLLATSEDELTAVIEACVSQTSHSAPRTMRPVLIKPTTTIYIANNTAAESLFGGFDIVVSCTETPSQTITAEMKERYIHLQCPPGKIGSRQLRTQLMKIDELDAIVRKWRDCRFLITCQTGENFAVGVTLAIICLFYDDQGMLMSSARQTQQNKAKVKHRLSWIMASMPNAAPSRATLQSINSYLFR